MFDHAYKQLDLEEKHQWEEFEGKRREHEERENNKKNIDNDKSKTSVLDVHKRNSKLFCLLSFIVLYHFNWLIDSDVVLIRIQCIPNHIQFL